MRKYKKLCLALLLLAVALAALAACCKDEYNYITFEAEIASVNIYDGSDPKQAGGVPVTFVDADAQDKSEAGVKAIASLTIKRSSETNILIIRNTTKLLAADDSKIEVTALKPGQRIKVTAADNVLYNALGDGESRNIFSICKKVQVIE